MTNERGPGFLIVLVLLLLLLLVLVLDFSEPEDKLENE
jgi:hypothetical protein